MSNLTGLAQFLSRRKTSLVLAVAMPALLVALPLICAERGGASRAPAARPAVVDRSSHGSVRHVDTYVVQRPAEVRNQPVRPVEAHHDVVVHRDAEADIHRQHFWNDFAFGRRHATLPVGFISLSIGGLPYFYNDGVYYQQAGEGYNEIYPPVGADITQPPDGAEQIVAGAMIYYYAGGAFYQQQPDGTFAIVPTPIGVVVPDLPPGAVQVSVNGTVAYQFNGVYYEPIFLNGVTQYETFVP
jgi:hypothetical protein